MKSTENNNRAAKLTETEAQLRESELRFRMLFEQVAVGMAFVGIDGQWLRVNKKLSTIIGYTQEELRGYTFQDITYPDDLSANLEYAQSLINGEIPTYAVEKRYIHKDSSLIWVNLTVSLTRDSVGSPLYFIAIIEDISGRKRAEAAAMAHASQLEAILAAMADAVMVYDQSGAITFASPAARALFPLSQWPDHVSAPADERAAHYLLRDEHGQVLPPGASPVDRLLSGETLTGANAMDVMMRVGHGNELQISISGSPMHNEQEQIIGAVLIARDVTERRQLERRTQKALEGLLDMAEALVELPVSLDQVDRVGRELSELTCSVLACQRVSMLVIEPETQIIRPLAVVGLSPEHEEEWWAQKQQQEVTLAACPPEFLAFLQKREVQVLDMHQPPFIDQNTSYTLDKVLIAPMFIGDRLIGILTLDYGSSQHLYTTSELALASAVAKLSALVMERQRLLNERAEAQGREVALREANLRMEEFLGVASHELRTPLTTIKANVQLAIRRLKALLQSSEEPIRNSSDKIGAAYSMLVRAERQVGVLNRLVSDLIDISRIQTGRLQLHLRQEPCDLITIVQETVQEQRTTAVKRTISLELCEELSTAAKVLVVADRDRIVQVLTNYLSNALKYSSVDKHVVVSLEIEKTQEARVVRLSVKDQGPGLTLEEQQHVWDCFYQSQEVAVLSGSGVGLGLGLYISQTLIERHQGQVGVDSIPGKGSTFWFTLPVIDDMSMVESNEHALQKTKE